MTPHRRPHRRAPCRPPGLPPPTSAANCFSRIDSPDASNAREDRPGAASLPARLGPRLAPPMKPVRIPIPSGGTASRKRGETRLDGRTPLSEVRPRSWKTWKKRSPRPRLRLRTNTGSCGCVGRLRAPAPDPIRPSRTECEAGHDRACESLG